MDNHGRSFCDSVDIKFGHKIMKPKLEVAEVCELNQHVDPDDSGSLIERY